MVSYGSHVQLRGTLRAAKELHDEHILHPGTASPDSQLRLKQLIDSALLLAGGMFDAARPLAAEVAGGTTNQMLDSALDGAINDEIEAQQLYQRLEAALKAAGLMGAAGIVHGIGLDESRHEQLLRGVRGK